MIVIGVELARVHADEGPHDGVWRTAVVGIIKIEECIWD